MCSFAVVFYSFGFWFVAGWVYLAIKDRRKKK